jgi:hypothetical protein
MKATHDTLRGNLLAQEAIVRNTHSLDDETLEKRGWELAHLKIQERKIRDLLVSKK